MICQNSGAHAAGCDLPLQLQQVGNLVDVAVQSESAHRALQGEFRAIFQPFFQSQVFHAQGVNLQNAKVATFGSQAEDVFHVTNRDNLPLTEAEQNSLRDQLIETLNTDY